MAKLVLVNHWSPGIGNNKPPLGLCYLAAYLKKYLTFDDISIINTGDETFEKIKAQEPDVVGFTNYTAGCYDLFQLIEKVKTELNCITLIGGPHITSLPHQLPEFVDVGVVGEGEQTLLELMQIYLEKGHFLETDLNRIQGIVFRKDGHIIQTDHRPFIEPLDKVPMPDRDMLDMEMFLKPSQILMNNEYLRGTTMITSRGCPYHCVYCQVSAMWGKPRFHSVERVVEEMEWLYHRYQVEGIAIADDLFINNIERIENIIDLMDQKGLLGKIRFFVDLRADLVNDRLMRVLQKMGVVKVSLGLESGSDRILQYLKGNTVSLEINRRAVQMVNQYDIGCHCCFMIGAPPETMEDIEMTRSLIREILDMHPRNFCQVTVTTPLPGTSLWNDALEKGLIPETVDWRQFSLSPLMSKRADFYINEHIPFETFLKVVQDTMDLCNSRRLRSILTRFSWRYILRIFAQPRLAFKILENYLKFSIR